MKSIFLPCWKGSSVIQQSPFGNAKKALSHHERAFFMFRNSVFQFFVLCIMLIYSVLYSSLIKTLLCRHFGVSEYHAHSRGVGVALFHTRACCFLAIPDRFSLLPSWQKEHAARRFTALCQRPDR